jgi:hypothetical protein
MVATQLFLENTVLFQFDLISIYLMGGACMYNCTCCNGGAVWRA